MASWAECLTQKVGSSDGAPKLREEWHDLSDEKRFLFLEGLRRFQAVDSSNPLSYYQIAGIHGLPFTTWPNKSWNDAIKPRSNLSQGGSGGFCTHSSVLFLTWHRPYLALFEGQLYKHVQLAAASITDATEKAKYQKLAKDFRMPYWDWARKDVEFFPYPALGSTPFPTNRDYWKSSTFRMPQFTKDPRVTDDYNPLFTYKFPPGSDQGLTRIVWWNNQGDVVATKDVNRTVRYPSPNTGTPDAPQQALTQMTDFFQHQRSATNPSADGDNSERRKVREMERNLSERTAYLLKAYQRYGPMCHNSFPGSINSASKFEIWGSLEDIHNTIHAYVGSQGQMGAPPTSAYDPIFWLHHANIDRLFAIWQALHETPKVDSYVTDEAWSGWSFNKTNGYLEGITTPLWPFRRQITNNVADDWWTSDQSRRTETFGYSYPEIQGFQYPNSTEQTSQAQITLSQTIDRYYSNLGDFIIKSRRNIQTAGAEMLPQAAMLKTFATTADLSATVSEMKKIDDKMPTHDELLQESLGPEKPFLRDLAPNGKYLEWLVDIKAEKHAMSGQARLHVFLGPVEEQDSTLWPISPNHVGTFSTFGQDQSTQCEQCKIDQAAGKVVTGQIPLTIALAERYLAEIIPDLSEESVIPFLQKNLHWRVALPSGGQIDNRGTVDGLKVAVISNEVTVSDDPAIPPSYAYDVKVYPEITTNLSGQGRGDGTGITAGEVL